MATLDPGVVATCPAVDADAVREIVDTDLTDARINNFINFAYYVSRPVSGKLGNCGGSNAECAIVLLLSAHFLTAYEGYTKSESVAGEWSFTRMGKDGLGLQSSRYGQDALSLDCSGELAKTGMKRATIQIISYYESAEARGFIDSDLV